MAELGQMRKPGNNFFRKEVVSRKLNRKPVSLFPFGGAGVQKPLFFEKKRPLGSKENLG